MVKLNKRNTLIGTSIAEQNTWKSRYKEVIPDIKKVGNTIQCLVPGKTVTITEFDEITLTLLLNFEFIPVWVIEKWYGTDKNGIASVGIYDGRSHLRDWIEVGLCYIETDARGAFIRPTRALYTLYSKPLAKYNNIPEALMNHSVDEMCVSHDLMLGQSPIFDYIKYTPRMSKLGLGDELDGTNVIFEREFRFPGLFSGKGMDKYMANEAKVKEQISRGELITSEMDHPIYFPVVKKVADTGIIKEDYVLHLPDMIIPMFRNPDGTPQSSAIEVEISPKSVRDYEETFRRYKDNNKFGVVIWLTIGAGTANCLKKAFDNVGGTGNTKMVLMDYPLPKPDFTL